MTFTGRINHREYDNKLVSYYVSLSLSSRMEVQCSADIQSEDDLGGEVECEEDPLTWQSLVSRGVLASLTPQAIKRQEVINGEPPTLHNFFERDIKIMKHSTVYMHVSVHLQSCFTLSAPTCECWRRWTVFSTRDWAETVSFLQKTSDTSLSTLKKSFSCMVTLYQHSQQRTEHKS